jgi:hypothetical protein
MEERGMLQQTNIVNANDIKTHLVNIDSRFRKSSLEPPTDFQYSFARAYKNVIKIRIASVEIPMGFYGFSKAKKNTMFRLDATDYVGNQHNIVIVIPDGDYTPCQLIDAIQQQLNGVRDRYGLFFRIAVDPITRRTTIYHDGSAAPPCPPGPTHCPVAFGLAFVMVGQEERVYDFGLGYNLGFTNQFYVVNDQSITSESLLNTEGDTYFLLAIEDFYAVDHKTIDSYVQCMAKILVKRHHSEAIIFDDGYTVLSNEIVLPRPIDLKQVRIRLLDCYGVPIDLHYLNLSISVEISEVMNMQVYDDYRLSIWTEAEPRATKMVSGSAAGIAPPALNYK